MYSCNAVLRRLIGVGPLVGAFLLAPALPAADKAPPAAIAPFDANAARQHQSAWAKHLRKSGVVETNSIGMKLALIPPGDFLMGSTDADVWATPDEKPQHLVRITRPFCLGQYEVTQGQWRRVMGSAPWQDKPYSREGADYPATYLRCEDASKFCERLTELERQAGRLSTRERYLLPTEAQWEYACRAGSVTRYGFGNDAADLHKHGWFGGIYDLNTTHGLEGIREPFRLGSNVKNEKYPHLVGQKLPNRWGLYDMHGNVWEFCAHWFEPKYAGSQAVNDPSGPESGTSRIARGGSWTTQAERCRSASRGSSIPAYRPDLMGFRVARTLSLDKVRPTEE